MIVELEYAEGRRLLADTAEVGAPTLVAAPIGLPPRTGDQLRLPTSDRIYLYEVLHAFPVGDGRLLKLARVHEA